MKDVTPDIDPTVAEIDQAAFQLRRLWAKPHLVRKLRETCEQGERPIQMSNLMVIHVVSRLTDETDEDVTVGAVAERLDIDPSTASRLVGHAIDAGFITREPSSRDARRAHLGLTGAGRRVKETTDQFRLRFIADLVADWPSTDRAEFARLLRRFTDAVAAFPLDLPNPEKIFQAAEQRD